ncbi:single-strand DNA-binding protein [Branchiibius hedensis]|uniref:Single-strand DNA-binding protein n=1 Tax=Branchiibius hedensis TaxID=672460 RepID=A0A2Y8ZPB5_9MICO|nr:single-stranded DNA-binding protein [Branchiibius hedensis]PWJ25388.1 single-strand DNA-binding protein [Branchiibius hedensis]SSA34201.1 single-strand DNA-binding protein [Branchiibius hedensis]
MKGMQEVPTVEQPPAPVNTVTLCGRVSADPTVRELPSGDEIVTFRLVVARPEDRRARVTGQRVDTFDLVCWATRLRRQGARLADGDEIAVSGSLRRRFWRAGAAVQSRVEVEVTALTVLAKATKDTATKRAPSTRVKSRPKVPAG